MADSVIALKDKGDKPLAFVKRDVRKCVEDHLGCTLGTLDGPRLDAIRAEFVALRKHYRSDLGGAWAYGESGARLVAYSLGYYPYHVELVAEALAAVPEIQSRRRWDLRAHHRANSRRLGTRYALIGCGAAPELYGVLRYLAAELWREGNRGNVIPDLKITLHEPEQNEWKPIADAVTKQLLKRHRWVSSCMDDQQIRIGWSNPCDGIPQLQLRGRYDFVLLQLVLNELDPGDWIPWLRETCDRGLASGGLVCVIDTDRGVHDIMSQMPGFCRSVDLNLRWGQEERRRLDARTTACLFPGGAGERERLAMRAKASFLVGRMHGEGVDAARPPRRTGRAASASVERSSRPCVECSAPVPVASGRVYCERHIRSVKRP